MICWELKIIHIHICRTAGTSIKNSFEQTFPGVPFIGKHRFIRNFPNRALNKCKSFCVVRNPFDKIVSQWLWGYKRIYKIGFLEFLQRVRDKKFFQRHKNYWYAPQIEWIVNDLGEIIIDRILRFENLQAEFDQMCRDWKFPEFKLIPNINSAETHLGCPRKPYKQYYNEESAKIVRELYCEDFKRLNYDSDDHILHQ